MKRNKCLGSKEAPFSEGRQPPIPELLSRYWKEGKKMANNTVNVQTATPELKKTLGLMGLMINAMALIAPGAFLWLNYQAQAAQVDPTGNSTAPDMWFGLFVALILSFLTAASYSWLAKRYPDAGCGSSYYFAQRALLDRGSSNRSARNAKFTVGWLSHIYYWVYPGVMVAFMTVFITFILQTIGYAITLPVQIGIAVTFSMLVGFIAYRGIQGSTRTNLIINIVQLMMLVGVTVLALAYRLLNPVNTTFYFTDMVSIVSIHDVSHVLFQATLAILVLVGFESITALTSEAKNPRDIPRAIMLSLLIQGGFAYLFGFFGLQAWINSSYTFASAAASSAPLGDMVRIIGNVFFGGNGFVLMMAAAAAVAAAILGTTLACLNTGVRVTYAISRDAEVPEQLGKLNTRYGTPAIGTWALTAVSAVIGAFGVLSLKNLTAIILLSNLGTFLLYGVTCIIAIVALSKERRSIVSRFIIPLGGFIANLAMMAAVLWLGFSGGSDTQWAALFAVVSAAAWMLIGLGYFVINSKTTQSPLFPFPGQERPEDIGRKYSINGS
jgi:APA family basic amino acid/polyamine antiporter